MMDANTRDHVAQPKVDRVKTKRDLASLPRMLPLLWHLDLTKYALESSAWRPLSKTSDPLTEAEPTAEPLPPLCQELGRRMLTAHLEASEWVLRRVEKVSFEADRGVRRSISVELLVPDGAPEFVEPDGTHHWLVPLSVMRRRTLVGLDLRDEHGRAIPTLGYRLTEELDESMLLAAAAGANSERAAAEEKRLERFVHNFIEGDREDVDRLFFAEIVPQKEDVFPDLRENALFMWTLRRLHHGFSLYILLPVALGRHRSLQMSFEEPATWRYQRPWIGPCDAQSLRPMEEGALKQGNLPLPPLYPSLPAADAGRKEWDKYRANWIQFKYVELPEFQRKREDFLDANGYKRDKLYHLDVRKLRLRDRIVQFVAMFGLRATRIRFQIPSAELAANYQFEVTAPPGVRIEKATLLAGRPNDPLRHVSIDRVEEQAPTVGLQAREVPNGSSCRIQLELGIPTRGWLDTMSALSLVIPIVLFAGGFSLVFHATRGELKDEIPHLVLLLVTTAAGAAALIAQREFRGFAARLVAPIRVLGGLVVTLPVVQAGALVYATLSTDPTVLRWSGDVASWVIYIAPVATILLTGAWIRSKRVERKGAILPSRWDITDDSLIKTPPRGRKGKRRSTNAKTVTDYLSALKIYKFDSPAILSPSAESWHEWYRWNDRKQYEAIKTLKRPLPFSSVPAPLCTDRKAECLGGIRCLRLPERGGHV